MWHQVHLFRKFYHKLELASKEELCWWVFRIPDSPQGFWKPLGVFTIGNGASVVTSAQGSKVVLERWVITRIKMLT